MKIAVFISGFPIQAYLKEMLDLWVAMGHEVHLYRTHQELSGDTADLENWSVPVIEIDIHDLYYRLCRYLDRHAFQRFHVATNRSIYLLASRFLRQTRGIPYDVLMGVEKIGVIVAGELSRKQQIPYIYYSLELYIEDHPSYQTFGYLRKLEERAHANALATIVQDRRRAEVLAVANRLSGHHFIFLPIGATDTKALIAIDNDYSASSSVGEDFMILYVGALSRQRRIAELIAVANELGEGEFLYLHGLHHQDEFSEGNANKIIITCNLLPEQELSDLVARADIGVALYCNQPMNDRLTAFSSHKIALYLMHGKPIIVPRNESYEDLLSAYPCGEMIEDIKDLPGAVSSIRRDYRRYSQDARRAFDAYYNLEHQVLAVIEEIGRLVNPN